MYLLFDLSTMTEVSSLNIFKHHAFISLGKLIQNTVPLSFRLFSFIMQAQSKYFYFCLLQLIFDNEARKMENPGLPLDEEGVYFLTQVKKQQFQISFRNDC